MPSATSPDGAPERVRVRGSRRGTRAPARRPLQAELSEQTELGEVYLRGLMRAQLRLAGTVLGFCVIGLGGLPLVFWLLPASRTVRLFDLPLAWLLVGVVIYPVMVLLAASYVRRATKIESDFIDVVKGRR